MIPLHPELFYKRKNLDEFLKEERWFPIYKKIYKIEPGNCADADGVFNAACAFCTMMFSIKNPEQVAVETLDFCCEYYACKWDPIYVKQIISIIMGKCQLNRREKMVEELIDEHINYHLENSFAEDDVFPDNYESYSFAKCEFTPTNVSFKELSPFEIKIYTFDFNPEAIIKILKIYKDKHTYDYINSALKELANPDRYPFLTPLEKWATQYKNNNGEFDLSENIPIQFLSPKDYGSEAWEPEQLAPQNTASHNTESQGNSSDALLKKKEETIAQLREENAELRKQIESLENEEPMVEEAEKINPSQKLRIEFLAQLIEKAGCELSVRGNKAKVAHIITVLANDIALTSAKNHLSDRKLSKIHDDDVKKLNKLLRSLEIDINLQIS